MRSVKLLVVALVVVVGQSGCGLLGNKCGEASTGWHFEVGKPSVLPVQTPTLLTQQSGMLGVQPLAGLAGMGSRMGFQVTAPLCSEAAKAPEPIQRMPVAAPSCTLQDVCDKLDRVLQAVSKPK